MDYSFGLIGYCRKRKLAEYKRNRKESIALAKSIRFSPDAIRLGNIIMEAFERISDPNYVSSKKVPVNGHSTNTVIRDMSKIGKMLREYSGIPEN